MNLEEMLGIDPNSPQQRLADELVKEDDELLDALRTRRRMLGLSQAEIGERMGISQGAVARIEAGDRDPRLSTIRRYAHAVDALVTHSVLPGDQYEERLALVADLPQCASEWESGLMSLTELVERVALLSQAADDQDRESVNG